LLFQQDIIIKSKKAKDRTWRSLLKSISTLLLLALLSTPSLAYEKTICGYNDDRLPSFDMKVARALKDVNGTGGCTVTMIGKSCAVSAGHCASYLKVAEFNTPPSIDGQIQHPAPVDVYHMEEGSLFYRNGGPGKDYAVVRYLPNKITGQYPGDVQGNYEVSFEAPVSDIINISLTGYGLDRKDPERNLAQQNHTGQTVSINENTAVLRHAVDTMGGNSGSSIIDQATGKIIGIHTHGGCSRREGSSNQATSIYHVKAYTDAIKACLAHEANL
jgi:V8-like Glu-specific endopeptidase